LAASVPISERWHQEWLRGETALVTSKAQLAKLADVLARPRLRHPYRHGT